MVTLTWWILKKNCESRSCKRAASVLPKGCQWSCKRASRLTLLHCALEKAGSCTMKVAPHAGHMFCKICQFSSNSYILNQQDPVEKTNKGSVGFFNKALKTCTFLFQQLFVFLLKQDFTVEICDFC